jgi:hypothetical protein
LKIANWYCIAIGIFDPATPISKKTRNANFKRQANFKFSISNFQFAIPHPSILDPPSSIAAHFS